MLNNQQASGTMDGATRAAWAGEKSSQPHQQSCAVSLECSRAGLKPARGGLRLVDAVLDLVPDLELTGDGRLVLAGDGHAEAAAAGLLGELDEVMRLVEQLRVGRDGVVDDDFDRGVLEVEDGDLAGGFGIPRLGLAGALLLAGGFRSFLATLAFGDHLGAGAEVGLTDVGTALRLDRVVGFGFVLGRLRVFLVGHELALDLDVAGRVAQVEGEFLAVGHVIGDAGAVGLLQFAGAVRFEDAHFARRQRRAQTVALLVAEAQLHRDRQLGQVARVVAVEGVVLLAGLVRVVLVHDRDVTEEDQRRAVGHAVFQRDRLGELVHLLVAYALGFGAVLREVRDGLQRCSARTTHRSHCRHGVGGVLRAGAVGGVREVVAGDELDARVVESGAGLVGQVHIAGEAFQLAGGAVVEHLVPGGPVDRLGLVEQLDAEVARGLDIGLEGQDGQVGQTGRDAVGERELRGQGNQHDLTAHAQDGDAVVDDVLEDAGGAPLGASLRLLDQGDLGADGLGENGLGTQIGRAQRALTDAELARALDGDDGLAVRYERLRQTADVDLRLACRQADVAGLADDRGAGLVGGQLDRRGDVGLDDGGRRSAGGVLRGIRHEFSLPLGIDSRRFPAVSLEVLVLVYQQ